MPADKRVVGEGAEGLTSGSLVETSPGRVLFNDIVHSKMAFYNLTMRSKDLSRVISDSYLELGRRETIGLLDRMKQIGFNESTQSGLLSLPVTL
jgi:DNA-directed RNA polymerase subunit beta'